MCILTTPGDSRALQSTRMHCRASRVCHIAGQLCLIEQARARAERARYECSSVQTHRRLVTSHLVWPGLHQCNSPWSKRTPATVCRDPKTWHAHGAVHPWQRLALNARKVSGQRMQSGTHVDQPHEYSLNQKQRSHVYLAGCSYSPGQVDAMRVSELVLEDQVS